MITEIPEGNYAIVAVTDSAMHRFALENPEDSVEFIISEEAFYHVFGFTAVEPPQDDSTFQILITNVNRLAGGTISITRPVFLFNIYPTFYPVSINGQISSESDQVIVNPHYGIFGYLYVVSNNYFNTPAHSHWQINWSAQTIEKIE